MPAPKSLPIRREPTTLPSRYGVVRRTPLGQLLQRPEPPKTVPRPQQKPKAAEEKEQATPKPDVGKTQTEALRRLAQQTFQQSQARLQTLAAQLQLQTAMAVVQAAQNAASTLSGPVAGTSGGQVNLATFQKPLPKWYTPTLVTWKGVTLQEDAMRALQRASQMVGVPILGGGFRSHSSQVELYQRKPGVAAPPGYSYHEVGLAIDVDVARLKALGLWERARRALLAVGFRQFDPQKEPWHFSYIVVG